MDRKPENKRHENRDPVCGANVEEKKDHPKSEYEGKTYHFCGDDCRQTFEGEPQRYAKKRVA